MTWMNDPALPRLEYSCLWCGARARARSADDLEAWAQLCPDCLGRAGESEFLRYRLHAALEARARVDAGPASVGDPSGGPGASGDDARVAFARRPRRSIPLATADTTMPPTTSATDAAPGPDAAASPRAAAPGPAAGRPIGVRIAPPPDDPDGLDDWYLGRGAHDRGAIAGGIWHSELDAAVLAVDRERLVGRIVEPRCGVGFWSVLLASAGELTAFDDRAGMLDRARDRLVAHRLRAHLHDEDAHAAPGAAEAGAFDAAFLAMTLSQLGPLPRARMLAATRLRLRPGGRLVVVDLGRPGIEEAELRAAVDHLLGDAFATEDIRSTGRHFVVIAARALG
jgi:SAM-dependent methyltransferase